MSLILSAEPVTMLVRACQLRECWDMYAVQWQRIPGAVCRPGTNSSGLLRTRVQLDIRHSFNAFADARAINRRESDAGVTLQCLSDARDHFYYLKLGTGGSWQSERSTLSIHYFLRTCPCSLSTNICWLGPKSTRAEATDADGFPLLTASQDPCSMSTGCA